MKKKLLITALLFIVGLGVGKLYKPIHKPVETPPYSCNRISKYDFYDYEEAVLKEGDEDKLGEILCECSAERFPYMIVMYDVYHENVCNNLGFWYSVMQEKYHKRNLEANYPLREFVKSVLIEYVKIGDKDGNRELQQFLKDEKSK